jgi:KDO2-lipid IV(A) lauroyltransferase
MPRQLKPLPSRLQYYALGALAGPLNALPLERAVRAGAAMGGLAGALDRLNRPVALRNLEIAFPDLPESARLDILRRTYRNWGRSFAEWLHLDELNRANIERFAVYSGWDNWEDEAHRLGARGIIILSAHFGNFELMTVAHSIYGHRVAIVHRPLRNLLIDKAVCAARVRFGNHIVYRKRASREVVKLMREKWMIGVALDLDVRRGVFVDFFSKPASTSDVVARLAMATGAPVVPCFIVRDGDTTHHKIVIHQPLEMEKSADREASVRANTQRCVAAIEQAIRSHPDHWNWIHRRWKTRPPGEAPFY